MVMDEGVFLSPGFRLSSCALYNQCGEMWVVVVGVPPA